MEEEPPTPFPKISPKTRAEPAYAASYATPLLLLEVAAMSMELAQKSEYSDCKPAITAPVKFFTKLSDTELDFAKFKVEDPSNYLNNNLNSLAHLVTLNFQDKKQFVKLIEYFYYIYRQVDYYLINQLLINYQILIKTNYYCYHLIIINLLIS
eukprot:TRINITY_DN6841_c0_g1_i5.p1 TRINITY_DN6841_c0_g1~~TRINITY_DN6841_c0_g1_i5.p1  ORF type:complete len:153 (-),score=0.16 TRINITY_DN6841_c0_g1_i5:356-814(-)